MAGTASWIFGRRRQGIAVQKGFARTTHRVAAAMAVAELGFVAGLFAVFGDSATYAGRLGRLRALLVLPLLGTSLTAGVVICVLLAWWRGLWSLPIRVHYTAVALAGVAFTWFQASWNLLRFRL